MNFPPWSQFSIQEEQVMENEGGTSKRLIFLLITFIISALFYLGTYMAPLPEDVSALPALYEASEKAGVEDAGWGVLFGSLLGGVTCPYGQKTDSFRRCSGDKIYFLSE